MSDSVTQGSYGKYVKNKCKKSKDGEHKYEVVLGSWPSCKMECIYCKDSYYTK